MKMVGKTGNSKNTNPTRSYKEEDVSLPTYEGDEKKKKLKEEEEKIKGRRRKRRKMYYDEKKN